MSEPDLTPAEHLDMAAAHHEAAHANIDAAAKHVAAAGIPPATVPPDTTKAFPSSAADKARAPAGSQVARTIAAMRPRSGRS